MDYIMMQDCIRTIDYKNDNGSIIGLSQWTNAKFNNFWWNTEGDRISFSKVHEYEAMCFASESGMNCVLWNNGIYVFFVSTNLSMEEAIKIAESVKGGEE